MNSSIFKRFFSGGVLSAVRLICGFARIKALAVILGASGIGILAQANQFLLVIGALCSVNISVGIINRLRSPSRQNNPELRAETLGTALITTVILTTIFVALCLLGTPQ